MVMQRLWRPILGIAKKRLFVYYQKPRYFSDFPEPAHRIASEIEEFMSKHEIAINGNDVANFRPMFSFDETGFPDSVVGALKSKFDAPTVIQSITWPAVMSGRDLVGIARTGSGKTLAFMLPALVHISRQEPLKRGDGPMVLVLCPTRELAQQVQVVANEWSSLVQRVRTLCVFGGANRGPQEDKLTAGVEIVVATPGRLNDFLQVRVTNMRRCTYLVLDEADRMLDMGFEPQIRQIIERIGKTRQTMMYSATWPNEVRTLAGDFMKNYVHVKIGSAELAANKNITQLVHVTSQAEKDKKFWQLISELHQNNPNDKILVFVMQKRSADRLEYSAEAKGMLASAIHGDKTQLNRDRVLQRFREGKTRILFATDVAARGLDVNDIKYVINYDHPQVAEDYVHRIGRTARRESKGESHTFLTEEDAGERARDLIKVLQASDQPVPAELQKLASGRSSSTQTNYRRWGGGGGGFSKPFGYGAGDRNRSSSFSNRGRDRGSQFQQGNRYQRFDDEDEDEDNFNSRRDYRGSNRYSNAGERQRPVSRGRNDYDPDDFDVPFDDRSSRRGAYKR